MKRRTTYRREILELTSNDSPNHTNWQNQSTTSLVHTYGSDSDNDNSTHLNDKVNDFLKEIGELDAPKNTELNSSVTVTEMGCPWQECYDETTGFPYYWNINTNAVTWEMPPEYKLLLSQSGIDKKNVPCSATSKTYEQTSLLRNIVHKNQQKDLKKKPSSLGRYSTQRSSDSEDEKIELITSYGEESESDDESGTKNKSKKSNKLTLPFLKPNVDIPKVPIGPAIIYRIQPEPQVIKPVKGDSEVLDYNLKPPTQVDIKALVHKLNREVKEPARTKPLEELNEELRQQTKFLQDQKQADEVKLCKPPVDDIIAQIEREQPPDLTKTKQNSVEGDTVKASASNSLISLVAGYGDDSDNEDEGEEVQLVQPVKSLFPIVESQTIENTVKPHVKEAEEKLEELPDTNNVVENVNSETSEEFDSKIFKRKRRIALDVLPIKKPKPDLLPNTGSYSPDRTISGNGELRAGLGFQQNTQETSDTQIGSNYDLSKLKTGISFVKAETINVQKKETETNIPDENKVDEKKQEDFIEELNSMAGLIKEKIQFLEEGKEPISAVQIMSIKLETLFEAYQVKGITSDYFYKWLTETTNDLRKLEQEAVPPGWFCQWDRSNKRYFYRNQTTGHTQWEYPGADIVGGAEAMDICTTPPPPDEDVAHDQSIQQPQPLVSTVPLIPTVPLPPPPPSMAITVESPRSPQSPKTPPPPLIREKSLSPPPPPRISETEMDSTVDQPLPPGVDSNEITYHVNNDEDKKGNIGENSQTHLGSELESFYSDIASLNATATPTVNATSETPAENVNKTTNIEKPPQEVKKKKKKSSKIGNSFTLKNKEVSLLVEKWKKVQNDF